MTKKLVALEDVAFDVDRGRMIRILQKSRLSDPYAYIKDLVASAASTKAKHITVQGMLSKIVIRDDGTGISYASLDEKLANIFTEDATDELAGGLLSSFQAGVEEIHIESVPQQGEPYHLAIYYHDGDIQVGQPEPLQNNLSKGTRISLFKNTGENNWKMKLKSLGGFLMMRGIPELSRIRNSHPHSNLELKVNFRKVESSKQKPETLVSTHVNHQGVTGTMSLLQRPAIDVTVVYNRLSEGTYNTEKSQLSIFRKGFHHGEYVIPPAEILPFGPIFAELNYDKFSVDISGKRLEQDGPSLFKINEALFVSFPQLYKQLMNMKVKEEHRKVRQTHLLYFTAQHLGEIAHMWNRENSEKYIHMSNPPYSERFSHHLDVAMKQKLRPIYATLLKQKIYPTKEQTMVSLEAIFNHLTSGQQLYLDFRGYNYDQVKPESIILDCRNYDMNIVSLIFSQIERINSIEVLGPLGIGMNFAGKWLYTKFDSPQAQERKQERNKWKEMLKIPLIYRPIQATANFYDLFNRDFFNYVNPYQDSYFNSSIPKTPDPMRDMGSKAILGFASVIPWLTIYPLALPISIVWGAGETVAKGLQYTARTLETGLIHFRLDRAESRLRGVQQRDGKALETIVTTEQTQMEIAPASVREQSLAVKWFLRTMERAEARMSDGREYVRASIGSGIEYLTQGSRAVGRGLRKTGRGIAYAAGIAGGTVLVVGGVGLAVVGAASRSLIHGCSWLGQRYSPRFRQLMAQYKHAREERLLLTESLNESEEQLKLQQKKEAKDREISEKEKYHLKFVQLLNELNTHATFQSYRLIYHKEPRPTLMARRISDVFNSAAFKDPIERGVTMYDTLGSTIKIHGDTPFIKRLVTLLGETNGIGNLKEYLATLIIDRASITSKSPTDTPLDYQLSQQKDQFMESIHLYASALETSRLYHHQIFEERLKNLYTKVVEKYQQGNAEPFVDTYQRLDEPGKRQVLARILSQERRPAIDTILENDAENCRLLDEVGREHLNQKERERQDKELTTEIHDGIQKYATQKSNPYADDE